MNDAHEGSYRSSSRRSHIIADSSRPVSFSLRRRDSSMSNASFASDVEMAQQEVFAGPMSESIPSSITGFAHRRPRADSIASFTFYEDNESALDQPAVFAEAEDDVAVEDAEDEPDILHHDQNGRSYDLESGMAHDERRKSSTLSHEAPEEISLLRRASGRSEKIRDPEIGRKSQKLYIVDEDLTIVIAGFSTRMEGRIVYYILSFLSIGLLALILHWIPRWRVRLVGKPTALSECDWVVIENQWGEMSVINLKKVSYEHSLSSVFGTKSASGDVSELDEENDPIIRNLIILDYRYIRLAFNPLKDAFFLFSYWIDPLWVDVKAMRAGLESDERHRRRALFGENQIEIEEKPILRLLTDEALHPFYIFQVASLVLWSVDEYYYYAACIFLISVFSIVTTLFETRTTLKRLREISRFECDVRVLRSGFWRQIPSSDLVPGDVYEVSDPSLSHFPCDSLLLAGDCIVNESMLTGESVPVSKVPATNESLRLLCNSGNVMHADLARHFLFNGTKVIRARRPLDDSEEEAVALAMVIRIGFNTVKGSLIRTMLFPKPSGFKFYRDAFRYISVMGGIAALGFVASFINFVRLKIAWHLIFVRALDLITIVVPPALPATLTIGTNFALSRLKNKKIFCISPQRVNVGGKIDVVCFDKTGTLTEDGLDILGVHIFNRSKLEFSDLLKTAPALVDLAAVQHSLPAEYQRSRAMLHTMASCHSLRNVDDDLIGDPLDVKMFEFTEWDLEELDQSSRSGASLGEPSMGIKPARLERTWRNTGPLKAEFPLTELKTLKSFEFIPQLRRASVLVGTQDGRNGEVFVKGAPESIRGICRETSLPSDYDGLLSHYLHGGYRVIACGSKYVQNLNRTMAGRLAREDFESDLIFTGFMIFENRLKEATSETLRELNAANIRCIMCTGDNILTAISVAREGGLTIATSACFVPSFVEGDSNDPKARLQWQSVDNSTDELDDQTLEPLPTAHDDIASPYRSATGQQYSLALTGDVFRWVIEFGNSELLKRMLVRGSIFARMSPDEKHELVEKLQSIDYCCCFCGDGANDCGALKAADVGISLSEAEASVAAPFTSRIFDISCVPQVIREGRAALVTSFCCFKYMSLYSAIQFSSVSFLYSFASNLGDFQFLYIDICLVLPIAIFMGWTGAATVLSVKRPTANLVSRKVLTPLLGQIALCIAVQTSAFFGVRRQEWYYPSEVRTEKSHIKSFENTALFSLSCFQYVLTGLVLCVGSPYRQPVRRNLFFIATVVVTTLLSFLILFAPGSQVKRIMQLKHVPLNFKAALCTLAVVNLGLAWLGENFIFKATARLIGQIRKAWQPHHRRKRKEYKSVLQGMK